MISIPFAALSQLQLFILFTYTITILCILVIWYIQLRDCRRQYALSFFFLWHFVGSIVGIINMFLLSEVAFPFSLFDTSSDFSRQSMSASTSTSIHSLTHPNTSSGLTAIIYTKTLTTIVPESDEYTGSVNLCIVFAHLMSVQCLGSCLALTRWTWYIYRSLRRKRGVVNPKLVSVLQDNQPRGRNSDQNNTDHEFTPGFSFSRPFRSLADIQFRLPACVITPIVMAVLLLREIWKQLFFCCYSKHVVHYRHGADLDDNELFENWPKYPSQFDESLQVAGSQSSQRGSDAISVARSGSAFSTTPPTTLAAKLGVDQVDLSNPRVEEITYGYDISGMRIKYTQDSWHHHFKQKVKNHRKMLDEVTICIFWPLLVVLVLFFIKMPDRSYEVFATRGGCGLPKEGGRADFIMVTTIDAISTAFSAMGCLLAGIFVIYLFMLQPRLYICARLKTEFSAHPCFCYTSSSLILQTVSSAERQRHLKDQEPYTLTSRDSAAQVHRPCAQLFEFESGSERHHFRLETRPSHLKRHPLPGHDAHWDSAPTLQCGRARLCDFHRFRRHGRCTADAAVADLEGVVASRQGCVPFICQARGGLRGWKF